MYLLPSYKCIYNENENTIIIQKFCPFVLEHVVWECVVEKCVVYDAHLTTAPQHILIQHDRLPQHLVCKYELNYEYCNITIARNNAP